MTVLLAILSVLVLVSLAVSIYLLSRIRSLPKDITGGVTGAMQSATGAIGDINRSLGELKTRGERLEEFGRAINDIGSLLRPPQMRGMTGEVLLEKILSDMLPQGNYQMKYSYRSGEQVDAIIKFKDFILPIDSKFPLDSFRRMLECESEDEKRRCFREFAQAVKKQVDSIARKYISPSDRTFEFALMYVPSESVYYEAIVRDSSQAGDESLLSYSSKNRVYIVSPATFYPYIATIVHGLKAFRIEENAKQILERIGTLRKDFEDFKVIFDVVGSHLNDAHKKYTSEAARKLAKLDSDLASLELRHDEK
ncbi:MAG: DNA recombination protein RmuC [Candidatus Omnitrophota bacterium]